MELEIVRESEAKMGMGYLQLERYMLKQTISVIHVQSCRQIDLHLKGWMNTLPNLYYFKPRKNFLTEQSHLMDKKVWEGENLHGTRITLKEALISITIVDFFGHKSPENY